MGPSRAERRRERWILSHILVISVLSVIGLWGFFGVISPPGDWLVGYWCRCYFQARDEEEAYRALEHLFDDTSYRTERTFEHAERRGQSRRVRLLAERWFEIHGKSPLSE